ncbi:MAG: protein-S-isoprenylcysteine O-methyltransferase [Pseudomonadota bacterium]
MSTTVLGIIWGLAILAWVAIRMPRRRKAKKRKVVAHQRSLWERTALGLCILGLFVFPFAYFLSGWPAGANYRPSIAQSLLGVAALGAFLWVFYLAHKQLADNWSVTLEVRENHTLVQEGLYRYVRHPMYSSFWLWGLGQALIVPNMAAGLAGIASVALLYFTRVNKEEDMMRNQFGQDYETYSQKTGRIIPKLTAFQR